MPSTDLADDTLPAGLAIDQWSPPPAAVANQNQPVAGGDGMPTDSTAGLPDGTPGILFCGGFHSTMRGSKAGYLRQLCIDQGWSYTRFDYRGHGESPGDPADFTLHDWLDDTLGVLRSLPSPVIIVGSSMGAWLAVLAAQRQPDRVSGLLTLAAAADFTGELIWPGLDADQQKLLAAGHTVRLSSRYAGDPTIDGWPLRMGLFDSGRALSLLGPDAATALSLRCPLYMIHGTADTDVPVSQSQRLLDRSDSSESSLLLLKGADHRLSDATSLARIGQTLTELVARTRRQAAAVPR